MKLPEAKYCKYCGKLLIRKVWQGKKRKLVETNKRWEKRKYCGNACRSLQLSIDSSGEKNYFYGKHWIPHNYGKTSRFPLISRIRLLKKYNQENKQTFLIVTHNPEVAGACKKIIKLKDGKNDL